MPASSGSERQVTLKRYLKTIAGLMAVAGLAVAQEMGLSVPGDLSIVPHYGLAEYDAMNCMRKWLTSPSSPPSISDLAYCTAGGFR